MTPDRDQPFSPAFEAGMDARVSGAGIDLIYSLNDLGAVAVDWRSGWEAAHAVLRKSLPRQHAAVWEPAGPGTVRLPVPGGWIYYVSVISTTTTVAVFVPEPK